MQENNLTPLPLSKELIAFAEAHLGCVQEARFKGWQHAESRVWLLKTERGEAYLKQHKQDRKFKQERDAYLLWTPKLEPHVPRLIAVREEKPSALLLEAKAGELVEDLTLTPQEERHVYREAGKVLRQLHKLSFHDDDPMPPAEALRVRAAAWCERAAGMIDEEVIAWVRAELMVAGRFEGLKRVLCHRDYSPRNWLYDRDSYSFTLIDFEHTRPDVLLTDFLKLWDGPWQGRPELEAAFLDGYGRDLTPQERGQLKAMGALHALSTIVWSRDHQDKVYEQHGWRLMERLHSGAIG